MIVKNENFAEVCIVIIFDAGKFSECIICFNAMSKPENVMKLSCKHEYHRKCISEWFKEKRECLSDLDFDN